jgi:hypothetical protein
MQSNFDFLNQNDDTKIFLKDAQDAERQYSLDMYSAELTTARRIAENRASDSRF